MVCFFAFRIGLNQLKCLFTCLFLYNKSQKQQKYKKRDKKEQKVIDNGFI